MPTNQLFRITDIRHVGNNQTRSDGKYPSRIGCTFYFMFEPVVNKCAYFDYDRDNCGHRKDGVLRTSVVTDIKAEQNAVILTTMNSIYKLEYIDKEKENGTD